MKKTKLKLIAIISLMCISLATIPLLAGCVASDDKAEQSSLPVSSETSSMVTSSVAIPDISLESVTPSSKPTSSIPTVTVDGSPSSVAEKPAVSSTVSSSPTASSKPTKVDPPPTSSAPSQPSMDVNNPTDGTTKVEDGKGYIFIEGKWWDDNSYGQQMVDDSERVIYCPFCELEPKDCTCAPIGY